MREFRILIYGKSGAFSEVNLTRDEEYDREQMASELWKLLNAGIRSEDAFFRMSHLVIPYDSIELINVTEIPNVTA